MNKEFRTLKAGIDASEFSMEEVKQVALKITTSPPRDSAMPWQAGVYTCIIVCVCEGGPLQ